MQKLLDVGKECYIIGGAVRDSILGIEPHDYDLFTNATGEEILKIFPQGKVLGGEERQEKILTVIVDDVEISQYRKSGDRTEVGTTLEEHQSTCDLMINSLAMSINGKIIEDTYYRCALVDIKFRKIAFVGKARDRIKEDKLRVLRAIRFVCKYNFKLDCEAETEIEETSLKELSPERIREELFKIMQYDTGIIQLHKHGLLKQIIPELYHENHFLSGGDHHNETPFEHMCNAFKESCKITDNVLLRFACLMHDVGKGECRSTKIKDVKLLEVSSTPNGIEPSFLVNEETIHFYEHENKGAEIAEDIMNRLKFSKEDIKYVKRLVRSHMYSYKAEPGKKSYVRFFKKLEDNNIPIEDYIMLIYCDHQGNMKKPRIKFGDFIKGNWLFNKYNEIKYSDEPMRVTDLKINGWDVMKILDIGPGKKISEILKMLFDKVMEGKLSNQRAQLFNYLTEHNKSCVKEVENTMKQRNKKIADIIKKVG